jgi:hypothetical protein
MTQIIKRNTTSGKVFEGKIDSRKFIFNDPDSNIITQEINGNMVTFARQSSFSKYMVAHYDITDFWRNPDEAFIISRDDARPIIHIVEHKSQTRAGSVLDKLLCGGKYKEEYIYHFGHQFDIKYTFAVNNWIYTELSLKTPKYKAWREIIKKDDITILNGDSKDYFDKLHKLLFTFDV